MFYLTRSGLSKNNSTILMFALLGVFSFYSAKGFAQGVIYNQGFESGAVAANNSGNPPSASKDVSRAGSYSMKSYLNRLTSSTSYRTEIVVPEPAEYAFNDDYWIGFSIYLPSSYNESDVYEILAQWHARPDKDIGEDYRNPPLTLSTTGGIWKIGNKWDSKANTFANGSRVYGGSKGWDIGPVSPDKGRWVDWVFHIKWSWGSDGILQVWKDGKRVVERFGPNTFNDQRGPYLKLGIYTGWKDRNCCSGPTSKTVYHDSIRIARGSSARYEDVAPGGSSSSASVPTPNPQPPTECTP